MRRREFMVGVGSAVTAWPATAHAQQAARIKRIGILVYAREERANIAPMLRGLEALGYVDGKNIAIEYRSAEGKSELLAEAADELVRLKPDLIFSFGGEQAPIVKKATASIPIVVVVSNDPVESGIVASLGRPGGNITGVTWVHDQLAGKAVELLKDTVPSASRVAVIWNPDHADPEFRETQRASRTLEMQLQSVEVRKPEDFEGAFQAVERARPDALIVFGSRLMSQNRRRIGDFAAKNRLILVGVPSWLIEIGGVFNYGPNVPELTRWAATYVDKILKGARPADLPMQQPTMFELTVSIKRAKELGITIPPTVIARADRVIE